MPDVQDDPQFLPVITVLGTEKPELNCDYIIIEDADLTPEDLINHAKAFSLFSIEIYNMTKVLRLKGNYAYVIWSKQKAVAPSITGEQIW